MLTVSDIRHAWPEKAGFCLNQKNGHPHYSFVHFFNGVELKLHGETLSVPPHSCILFQPGTPKQFLSKPRLMHDWFRFTGDVPQLLEQVGIPVDTLLYPRQTDFITRIVREMEAEFFSQRMGSQELIHLKIQELFVRLARVLAGEETVFVDRATEEALYLLRNDVFSQLEHPWTVEEMAARAGMSRSRFHSVYRTVYGDSPIDDLIRARMEAARHALAFTGQSVNEIAEMLGYRNVTHFIRQFRELVGVTPLKYRQISPLLEHF